MDHAVGVIALSVHNPDSRKHLSQQSEYIGSLHIRQVSYVLAVSHIWTHRIILRVVSNCITNCITFGAY